MAKKIIVADDDQTLQSLYQISLSEAGFQVISAVDGQTTLNLILDEEPDLVILDLNMPEIDGFHVLEILKKTPCCEKIKFLVVSARGDDESKKRAMGLGCDDYLVKTEMNMEELINKIKSLLS